MTIRDNTIKQIRAALQRRSGKAWSVTGGRGTAYGWITINVPPAKRTWRYELPAGLADIPEHYEERDAGRSGGHMSPGDRTELAQLLGLSQPTHFQGESIPAGHDYYEEYMARAEGRTPTRYGKQYWD